MNDLVKLVSERFGSEEAIENPHNLVRVLKQVLAPHGYAVHIFGEIIELVRPERFSAEKHEDMATIYNSIKGWRAKCMHLRTEVFKGELITFWDNEFVSPFFYATPQEAYLEAISMAIEEGFPLKYYTTEELKVLEQMEALDKFLEEGGSFDID